MLCVLITVICFQSLICCDLALFSTWGKVTKLNLLWLSSNGELTERALFLLLFLSRCCCWCCCIVTTLSFHGSHSMHLTLHAKNVTSLAWSKSKFLSRCTQRIDLWPIITSRGLNSSKLRRKNLRRKLTSNFPSNETVVPFNFEEAFE